MGMETLNVSRRIGLSNLDLPYKSAIETVADGLKNMPLFDTLARLSSLNLVMSNERRVEDIEPYLRKVHLNISLQTKVLWFESNDGRGIIFNRQACLLLMQLARHFCDPNLKLEPKKIDLNLGWFFLIANDFLSFVDDLEFEDGKRDENLKRAAPHLTRQVLFNFSPQERYALPRSWLIFQGLKDQIPENNRQDVSALIRAKRPFDLDEYYLILSTIYAYWSRQSFKEWDASFIVINPTTVFSKIKSSPEKYLSILDSMSVDVKPTQKLPDFKDRKGWRKEIYEQFEIRLRPLIKINDVYICADLEFIRCAFWDGPYHLILTHYPNSTTAAAVLNYLGDATEKYIQHLGKDAFGDSFIFDECGNGNPLGDGVVKIAADWIAVVESKAARPGINMVSGDKPITDLSDFNKLVENGLSQMSDRIAEFRKNKGFAERITPILVTAGYVPQHELIWELMLKKLNTLGIFNDPKCDFPFLIDVESWDVICAAKKAGLGLEKIIELRLKDHETKTSNPHYFLYKTTFDEGKMKEPEHPVLLSLFLDRMELMAEAFFESDLKNRTFPAGLWKTVFKI